MPLLSAVSAERFFPSFKSRPSALLAGTMLLELLYLLLVWHIHDRAHLGMSLLFIGAVWLMLTERPADVAGGRPHWSARLIGAAVMIGVAASCLYLWGQGLNTTEQHPLRLLPMFALLGAALWAEGYRGVRERRRELFVLFFLGGPHLILWQFDIPSMLALWDAKIAGFILWYGGVDVAVKETTMLLQGGAIRITPECAGSDIVTYLLGVAVVAVFLFPMRRPRYLPVLGMAAVIGFLTNVVRVAMLALLNTDADKASFNYWHTSEGSQVFGVAALILFALFYYFLDRADSRRPAHQPRSHPQW